MAELGDPLEHGGSARDVSIEMLDYDFLDKCHDPNLIRAIVCKLRSGEEGHFPELVKHAESRLMAELPAAERSKILRMRAEPRPEQFYEAVKELRDWEEQMANLMSKTKGSGGQQQHAPRWTSCAKEEGEYQNTEEVQLARATNDGRDRDTLAQSIGLDTKRSETKKLDAYNFRAWEQYNADEEIERLEKEEQEEELRKAEVATSTKARVEQDRLRRAKKRQEQLREAGKGRFKEILSPFERTRAAEREHAKGNESFKVKEYDEAFRCYTCSLALDDTNAKVYNNRAAAAHKLERFDQAEDDCTRAISLDPKFKKAWMRRGMVRHSRGKYADSIADFSEALLLDPNDKLAKKLRDHSASKELEVEGEGAGQAQDKGNKKRGRILIEEVDTLPDNDGKHCGMVCIPTTTMTAAPPTLGSKKILIANGRIE